MVSDDGRHLAMMPHLERSIFPWQCATYPKNQKNDDITPWIEAFVNARKCGLRGLGSDMQKFYVFCFSA